VNLQPLSEPAGDTVGGPMLEIALQQLAARATELDADPRFPQENFRSLIAAGVPQLAAERERCLLGTEIALIRSVASADASTARILDGHFNGVERLALLAPEELRARELEGVRRGELLLGVWGADPGEGEGAPARVERSGAGDQVLRGVKTFCSGAGGVQRALVVARDSDGARRLVYVDVSDAVSIDRGWYRASGLRASESHRVEFIDTPVLAVLGGPDEVMHEPWFSRDAVRTASTWAGIADCILRATVEALGDRTPDELRLHALGRMRVARGSIDRWLEHSGSVLQLAVSVVDPLAGTSLDAQAEADRAQAEAGWRTLSAECRLALADAARVIAAEAVRVCGSRALIGGGALERARRDLDLFLLQHRLDPKLVELGRRSLADGAR
jgi:alkylation response protein AidB-like acyl-CoA dehydrogenase